MILPVLTKSEFVLVLANRCAVFDTVWALSFSEILACWANEVTCNKNRIEFLSNSILTIYCISADVTLRIKSVACHNWLHLATCLGRYPAIIRPTRNNVIKVHSLVFSNGIPLFTL